MRGKRHTARRLMANLHCSCPTIGPLQLDSLIFPGREAVPALPSTVSFRPCRSANRQFASVRIPDGKRLVTDGPLTWPRRSARISSVPGTPAAFRKLICALGLMPGGQSGRVITSSNEPVLKRRRCSQNQLLVVCGTLTPALRCAFVVKCANIRWRPPRPQRDWLGHVHWARDIAEREVI